MDMWPRSAPTWLWVFSAGIQVSLSVAQRTSTIVLPGSTVFVTTNTLQAPVSTVTVSATTSNSPQYTNTLDLKTSILNSTNYYRYEHNATFLAWNDSLASYAQNYVNQCIWAHSHGPPGENLAQGYPDVTAAVDGWGDERALYDFAGNQTGFTEATGHFTQLVWKSTITVGCAAVDCQGRNNVNGFLLVCEYWPAGNIVDSSGHDPNEFFQQNVQAQVNNGGGFNEASATSGATGVGTSQAGAASTGTSTNQASGSRSTENEGDSYRVTICLIAMLAYACAFL